MTKRRRTTSRREKVLAAGTFVVVVSTLMLRNLVLPAYDQWTYWRQKTTTDALEAARLTRNYAARKTIDAQFEELGADAIQQDTDETTLWKFLSDIEIMTRFPNMTVLSTKPVPVRHEPTHHVYGVRITVKAKLHEVLQFFSELTSGKVVVATNSFVMRGLQGQQLVECTINAALIKLISEPTFDPGRTESRDAAVAIKEGEAVHAW